MSFARPQDLTGLLQVRAEHPDWRLVAGGTDVLVELNFGRTRPPGVIDVSGVSGLDRIERSDAGIRLGAGLTFGRIERELPADLPGLATAARTVGSPQIRATATLGGNLGTGSPAGDAHPFLLAAGAEVELASLRGTRSVPANAFFLAPGRTVLAPDEAITGVMIPVSTDTSQQFAKIGPRNAMVIAVASLALVIDWRRRALGVGLGSVAPTPLRAPAAEEYLHDRLWEAGPHRALTALEVAEFARRAADAARPIGDLRGSAAYRRHTVRVMAARCLAWALDDRGLGVLAA